MSNGFAPYILKDLAVLSANNYPGTKLTAAGHLGMLLENSNIAEAKLTTEDGHKRSATIKYKVRQTPDVVQEEDNCEIDFIPVYQEAEIKQVRLAKVGFHLSMETVSQYLEEASKETSIGNPAVKVIAEIVNSIQHAANAIITKIDTRLLGDTAWGTNVVEGNNLATTLNIGKDGTKYNLAGGFAKLLNDAFENEFTGNLLIVGSGKLNAHEMVKAANAISAAQNGLDLSRFSGYKFYPDLNAKTAWGTDHIGVFAQGSIHFVDFQKYVAFQSGPLGNSVFFQVDLPVNYGYGETTMKFDAQLKAIDCPTVLLNGYGEQVTYTRGYALYLSKTYGLFQTPGDAYSTSDRLSGVNGALHYKVSNDCEDCIESAPKTD
jgi:hypothetical protein